MSVRPSGVLPVGLGHGRSPAGDPGMYSDVRVIPSAGGLVQGLAPAAQDTASFSAAAVLRSQLASLLPAGKVMSFMWNNASPSPSTRSGTAPNPHGGGLPFDARGLPDYEAIRAGGGKVTGGVPGGFEISGWHDGFNQVTFFAAEVTPNGQPSQFIKGMVVEMSGAGSEADRRQFLEGVARYFDRLPASATEARQQATQGLPTFIATVGGERERWRL